MSRQPTPPELREGFEMFSRSLTGSFALYAWKTQLLPRLEAHREEIAPYIAIGQNALVQSSLVCIRSLDDFFLAPDKVPFEHDVLSHDFGFVHVGSPLGNSERTRINRMIVHMSYEPLWKAADYIGPSGDGSFDLPALLTAVVQRSIAFLDYCATAPLFSETDGLRKVSGLRRLAEIQLTNVQAVGLLERSRP